MSASHRQPITKERLVHTNASMLVVTSLFVFSRAALHISKRKTFEPQDFFIYLAYILYVSLWSCYLAAVPPLYRLNPLNGEIGHYTTTIEDAANALKLILAAQTCYYTLLLSVKLSLLTLYRKLLVGLPYVYNKIWWAIVVLCIAAWIGSVSSILFICGDLQEKVSSICGGSRNIIFSLYFSFTLDAVTNLLIVLFPIHIIWSLQMTRLQKIGIFVLFGSDFICIIFAILRVTQIGVDGHGKVKVPDPTWMLLWTVIECSVAIMVGCLPTFASLIRKQLNNHTKMSCTAHMCIQRSIEAYRKRSEASSKARLQLYNPEFWLTETNGSQDELNKSVECFLMSTTVHQYREPSRSATVNEMDILRVREELEGNHYSRHSTDDIRTCTQREEDQIPVH